MDFRPGVHSDGWDFYEDAEAVAAYVSHRDAGDSRNTLVEEAAFLDCVGDVAGLRCLDLGCGYGHYSEILASRGAIVTGVDRSSLMISAAQKRRSPGGPEYILADIENYYPDEDSFDLIISNLAFHYVQDCAPLFGRAYSALRLAGRFVFSVEHPLLTASRESEQWCDARPRRHWVVTDYFDEADRWGIFGRKYHHTLATWVNAPLSCGFTLVGINEPKPSADVLRSKPDYAEDLDRPLFLIGTFVK